MIPALFGLYNATVMANNSAAGMFGVNEARMGLANSMTGTESPAQVAFAGNLDKALSLQAIQHQTNFMVSQALLKQSQKMFSDEQKLKQRLMQAGATFA